MIEDKVAILEIKELSEETRHYMENVLRNDLQTISFCVENKDFETAKDEIRNMADSLSRMGLQL